MKYAKFVKAWDYVPNSRHHRHCPKGHYAVPDDVAEAAQAAGVLEGEPSDAPKGTRTGDLYDESEPAAAPAQPKAPAPGGPVSKGAAAPATPAASGSASANAGG